MSYVEKMPQLPQETSWKSALYSRRKPNGSGWVPADRGSLWGILENLLPSSPRAGRGQRLPFLFSASSVLYIPAMQAEWANFPTICKMWACPLQNPHRGPSKLFSEVSQYLHSAWGMLGTTVWMGKYFQGLLTWEVKWLEFEVTSSSFF